MVNQLKRNVSVILGMGLGASALFFDGLPGAVFILIVAAVLSAIFTRSRPSGVLALLLMTLISFSLSSAGLPGLLEDLGVNAKHFFQSYGLALHLGGLGIVLLTFTIAVLRQGSPASVHLQTASNDLTSFVERIGKGASLLFIPLMLIILYDISQRKLIGYDSNFIDSIFYFSSTKMQELQWHLHAVLFLLCLGFAYTQDAHVRIELVRDRLSHRRKVWLELFGIALFLLPYCVLLGEMGFVFAQRAWISNEASAAQTGLSHRWVIKSFVPLGFVILGLAGAATFLRSLTCLLIASPRKPLHGTGCERNVS